MPRPSKSGRPRSAWITFQNEKSLRMEKWIDDTRVYVGSIPLKLLEQIIKERRDKK